LTPDDDLERAIRQRLGAGELPEVAERNPIDRTAKSGGVAALAETLIRRKKANG
jgi:hypothetical protein